MLVELLIRISWNLLFFTLICICSVRKGFFLFLSTIKLTPSLMCWNCCVLRALHTLMLLATVANWVNTVNNCVQSLLHVIVAKNLKILNISLYLFCSCIFLNMNVSKIVCKCMWSTKVPLSLLLLRLLPAWWLSQVVRMRLEGIVLFSCNPIMKMPVEYINPVSL